MKKQTRKQVENDGGRDSVMMIVGKPALAGQFPHQLGRIGSILVDLS
jgi:hypothetical protein